jgi:hypothetical protein
MTTDPAEVKPARIGLVLVLLPLAVVAIVALIARWLA